MRDAAGIAEHKDDRQQLTGIVAASTSAVAVLALSKCLAEAAEGFFEHDGRTGGVDADEA